MVKIPATVCVDPDHFTTDANGRLQIKLGCGFEHGPDGIINQSSETRSARATQTQDTDILLPLSGEQIRVSPIAVATITNPSNCRQMLVQITEIEYHEVSIQPDGECTISLGRQINTEDAETSRRARHHVPAISNETVRFGASGTNVYSRVLDPGDTLSARVWIDGRHVADAPRTTFTFGQVIVSLLGSLI